MCERQPFWVNSTEMDFATAIEADLKLPIAFKDRAALNKWVDGETELEPEVLGRRDGEADVLLLRGLVKPWPYTREHVGQGLFYRQVWARVDYRGYRNALRFAVDQFERGAVDVDLYDADHAVSRYRLRKLWPSAWVNMVLVDRGVNRAIGTMLEREPLVEPKFPNPPDRIEINAESVLKTFFDRGDERMELERLREYLAQARRRFMDFTNDPARPGAGVQEGEPADIVELAMSENAWYFFDDFARALGVEPLDRPPTPRRAFG